MKKIEYHCLAEDEGNRLDFMLKKFLPEYGTRVLKRFCEQGNVLVNAKKAKASCKIKEHDVIVVQQDEIFEIDCDPKKEPAVIFENNEYLAVCKEAFSHSEHHALTPEFSVERFVHTKINPDFQLLNRLDYATSGILVFAKNRQAKEQWKIWQENQKIEKKYFAFTEGLLTTPLLVKNKIIADKRQRVRILEELGDRITKAQPFAVNKEENVSLADCTIYQGARHQIRAHLAFAGYSLVGDKKYGAATKNFAGLKTLKPVSLFHAPEEQTEKFLPFLQETMYENQEETFCLHHYEIICPAFCTFALPPYFSLLSKDMQKAVLKKKSHE